MRHASLITRWCCLILVVCCVLGLPLSAAAAESDTTTFLSTPQTLEAVPFAAFWDGVLGNRTRMVQVATIGMAIAIFILTRGHSQR